MKLPAGLEKSLAKFDRLSVRERALVAGAVLIALVMTWTLAIFDPLTRKENFLNGEALTVQAAIDAATQSLTDLETSDPTTIALAKEKKLQAELEDINAQLASRSGGLIEPERMVQVIHDVLSHQHGIALVSLQNKAVTSLIQPAVVPATEGTPAAVEPPAEPSVETAANAEAASGGPYVHTVELVVEGGYLDILAYLRALEALPWRFNWKVLELETARYPLNHVTIELSTLSMDRDWIGV